jgi:hypothetical protein
MLQWLLQRSDPSLALHPVVLMMMLVQTEFTHYSFSEGML